MKRAGKRILLLLSVIVVLSGCGNSLNETVHVRSGLVRENETEKELTKNEEKESSKNNFMNMENQPVKGINIKKINDVITQFIWTNESEEDAELEFQVISAEFSKVFRGKVLGDYEKEQLAASKIKIDENGNLADEYTYIWITLNVKNKGKECRWTPAQYQIYVMDDELILQDSVDGIRGEAFYINGMQVTEIRRDIFYVTLEEESEEVFLLGFWVKDELLNENIVYYISQTGNMKPGDESYAVQLK